MQINQTGDNATFTPIDGAPEWFINNIGKTGKSIRTNVAGAQVHMLAWNWDKAELPTLMLIHGYGAHAHWWSFLAPFFMTHFRVVALDLPGMGDSAPPTHYQDDCFARAIVGCIEQHQLQPVSIIGHSFGGAQSLRAMSMAPHLFRRGIIVDSNIRLPPEPAIRKLQSKGVHKQRQTREECIASFVLVPPQPNTMDVLVNYIAFHSCVSDEQGWHWKSDPNCINVGEIEEPDILAAVETPIDLIYGEKSFLNINNKPNAVLCQFQQPGSLVIIPEAGHHIMADQPLLLAEAITTLLLN